MSKEFDAWYFGMFPLEREMINAGSASSARNREQYLRCWQASRESLPSLFTAVDMGPAAADGFRDGVASVAKDALIGRIVFQYFDRMDDPAECDPLEKSVGEFLAAVCAAMSKEG